MNIVVLIFGVALAMLPVSNAQTIISKGCCVAIAIDQSTSLTDDEFLLMTGFASNIIDGFDKFGEIGGQNASVCVFSTEVTKVFGLNDYSRKEDAIARVNALEWQGGITFTNKAIDQLGVYLQECPSENNRAGLIITDGNSDDKEATLAAADRFKGAGNDLIVLGIGNIDEAELLSYASSSDLFFPVATFDILDEIKLRITQAVCSALAPAPPPNVCEKCTFMNGLYVYPDAQYCYIFHSCINYEAPYSYLRPCPFGQFFDTEIATCRLAADIRCPTDPCQQGVSDYPNHLVCSSYYVCSAGRTIAEECCEPGRRYRQGQGCVVDSTCTTPCPPVPRVDVCDRREYTQDTTKYEQRISTDIWRLRDCAPGTAYIPEDCQCNELAPLIDDTCGNEFYLSFEKNSKDFDDRISVEKPKPKVRRVTQAGAIGEKAAQFDGSNQLIVTGYSHRWWEDKRVFRTRFQETPRTDLLAGEEEMLFGNGDCLNEGSISVSYDRNNNAVKAKIVTIDDNGEEVITRLTVDPVSRGAWKDVELWYDGSTVRLTVDNGVDSKPTKGVIAQRFASLQIGSGCVTEKWFAGYMDEFYVFPCIPL